MSSRYKIGYYYERKTLQKLEKDGYICWRTPGSHSPIDVIAIKNENGNLKVKLIQIKATSSNNFNVKRLYEIQYLKKIYEYFNHPNLEVEVWVYNRENRDLIKYSINEL